MPRQQADATAAASEASEATDNDSKFNAELLAALEAASSDGKSPDAEEDDASSRPAKRARLEGDDSAHSRGEAGMLRRIPPEVLVRTLSFLSAEDLTTAAQACSFLRCATADNMLWRRLYAARWNTTQPPSSHAHDEGLSWKGLYMDKDRLAVLEATRDVPDPLRALYLQSATSKRSQALGRRHGVDAVLTPSPYSAGAGTSGDRVTAWRRNAGFAQPHAWRGREHTCRGRCTFVHLGDNVFVCEKSGWPHFCDEGCHERVVDHASDMLVCPISGCCFQRMLTACEEETQHAEAAMEEEGVGEDCGISGRLGRAYFDGYSCTNEAELRLYCGANLY